MTDDLLAALTEVRGGCGKSGGDGQVTWCHARGEYLCDSCRYTRNNEVLRVTLAEREAAMYPSQAALDAALLEAERETRSHP